MKAQATTCKVIRPGETYHGKQDLDYFAGISAQSVGAAGICMHLVTIPPGASATAQYHECYEAFDQRLIICGPGGCGISDSDK